MNKLFRWPLHTFAVDTLWYILGSILYAVGLYTFALNAGFAPGGVSGLALIINHYTGLPIGILQLVINIPLVFLSFKVIGLPFLARSVWAMLLSTLFLDVVFPFIPTYQGDALLASLFSGILIGAGLAVIYMRGGSTGGTDFLTLSIKKKWPHYSVGILSFATDAVVILLGGFAFGNIDAILYGVLSSVAASVVIDYLLSGAGGSKLAIIVTDHGKQLAEVISNEVGRGSTLVKSTGTYTGEDRDLLLCACARREIYRVRHAVRAADPDCLIMVTEASDVIGEGFIPPAIPGEDDSV